MESLDSIHSLFTARVDRRGGSYVIELPRSEVDHGGVADGTVYRVALLDGPQTDSDGSPAQADTVGRSSERRSTGDDTRQRPARNDRGEPARPVREGDVVAVTIDDIGDEGVGIARIGAGFVLFVSDADPGDEVAVEVTAVRDTYAFGDVVGQVDADPASPTP